MIGFQCPPSSQPPAPANQQHQHQNSSQSYANIKRELEDTGSSPQSHSNKRQTSSPGYHSAASSPGSSAASPISCISSSNGGGPSPAGPNSTGNTQPQLLDYFPELNQDGLSLSWFHEANSRSRLSTALVSHKLMIAGDISLAEMSRYPVPIMARPPMGVSDITLDNWLQEVVSSAPKTGVKLTFTSTRTVEPAFRVLARHAQQLQGPLVLNADVLARAGVTSGPSKSGSATVARNQQSQQNQNQQLVDAWTFLMLCRTRFPNCIISIGWCPAAPVEAVTWPPPQQQQHSISEPISAREQEHHLQDFDLDLSDSFHLSNQLSAAHTLSQLSSHLNNHSLNHNHNQNKASTKHHLLSQHLSQQFSLASSNASLNSSSSSGNSSGSPSPTSPVAHLLAASTQNQPTNLSLNNNNKAADQQTTMAAAMAAAAMVAATTFHHQQQQHMPLNLNINEADQSHLSNLAHKIQSFQRLASPTGSSTGHIAKKTALTCGNNPSPSPTKSTSPVVVVSSDSRQKAIVSQLLLKTSSYGAAASASPPKFNHQPAGYTREMIDKMVSLVKEYNLTQPVTFPVEARLLLRNTSLVELQRLLFQVGAHSTLTVTAKPEDLISVDELLTIRRAFGQSQLLFDLPEQLASALRQELD